MTRPPDVVIIGAPRSGTNMLRDLLTSSPEFGTWPCDEINPIWRHGNREHSSDELRPEHARESVRRFIRGRFERVRASPAQRVVEKTCANSLRVEFVRRVLPDAQFVLITRDGLDAGPSALERWHAPLALRYTLAKARFVPPSDLPYLGSRFVRNRLARRRSPATPTTWWGPEPDDARRLLADYPLDEVAVLQWKRCVEASRRGLAGLPAERLHHVVYESFVRQPEAEVGRLLDFLDAGDRIGDEAVAAVSDRSVGKGRGGLTADRRRRLTELASPELEALGYAAV